MGNFEKKKIQINKKFVNNYKYTHKILIIKYKILIKYFLGWEIFKIFKGQRIKIFLYYFIFGWKELKNDFEKKSE